MNLNKRLISFVVALVLMLSATVSAFAISYSSPVSMGIDPKYKELFYTAFGLSVPTSDEESYYIYSFICEYDSDGDTVSGEATPDYILGFFSWKMVSFSMTTEQFGDYVITVNSLYSPYELGYYIYSTAENRLYSLREAWDAELEGVGYVVSLLGRRIGDSNDDGALNIKDATVIQKHVAEIAVLDSRDIIYGSVSNNSNVGNKNELKYFSDFNRDGERNIKDATAIQKYIAGLPY